MAYLLFSGCKPQTFLFLILCLTFSLITNGQHTCSYPAIKPCPSSPNCISSIEKEQSKSFSSISYSLEQDSVIKVITNYSTSLEGWSIVHKEDCYLHFVVTTKVGKFIDDVEFFIEESKSLIHFRSKSRKGWYDFNANKRRMKKLKKAVVPLLNP